MEGWGNFFIGELGASAALTGLVLVSISINLAKIIQHTHLPNLALEALVSLIFIIFISTLMLVPTQPFFVRAIECIGGGILASGFVGYFQISSLKKMLRMYRFTFIRNSLYIQFSALCCVVAGIFFLTSGVSGYYWLVATTILAYIDSFNCVWILTIEINR